MEQDAVSSRNISVRFACQLFVVSETRYRYRAKLREENDAIVDWLLRITGSAQLGICPVLFIPA
jgi:putative transposase